MKPLLIVMCGISGSGKSTWAQQWARFHTNTTVVSTDRIRKYLFGSESVQKDGDKVFKLAYNLIWDELHKKRNVVFDAMSLLKRDRLTLIEKFGEMADMCCVVTGNDYARACENQRKRDRQVPDEVVLAQSKRFQMPTIDEGWKEIRNVY